MNSNKYRWILYFIVFVILSTIAVQLHWNYKNYLSKKQQLINDVQLSLDTAVEAYFAKLAEKKTLAFSFHSDENSNDTNGLEVDSTIHAFKIYSDKSGPFDLEEIKDGFELKTTTIDSLLEHQLSKKFKVDSSQKRVVVKKHMDSLSNGFDINHFKMLTSKVIVSLTNDAFELNKVDSILHEDFKIKQYNIEYGLSFKNDSNNIQTINDEQIETSSLSVYSKSAYLPKQSRLAVYFTNETKIILKHILPSILISVLLIISVISCLFYLLKIINQQKQLAEVKNDLISNITHEFKTPIATIGVAIESIKNFNVIDNKEKTKAYLDMSNDQLLKLNTMVEKLLETATLDSDSLKLNKERINISELIEVIANKLQLQAQGKTINLVTPKTVVYSYVDVFHFENAINNILDNAIKYGGNVIDIELVQDSSGFTISVNDDGNTLAKANKEKIFEKFYRVPKGNKHDIKGFGIGLYYAKKITEKHGGSILLNLKKDKTTFIISLPNE